MKRRSGFGWMELIIGIALAALGIFTFVYPDNAVTTLVIIYGIIAIITGIADVVLYVRVDKHLGFGPTVSLISGILSVMAGAMLLVYPNMVHCALSLETLAPEHDSVHRGQFRLLVHDDSQHYRACARHCDDIQPEHLGCGGRLHRRRIPRAVRH